ncbi:hypothetical protein [Helicobacter pylori]|uniref:Uncharacterized protein n=1 Tax=Helicobacter pylori GAM260BSi TaxID=1159046 RepID=M3QVZ1_HELPX|nr:hypothetical protein [Helicobacter pylori]EMH24606.1 hypothetical protein HMPREF1418_00482 [Helicobacter pylori GAM260BSi]EMH70075.1 hypothetical protein HMPREF1451_00108 [Helicobacter pylori HP260BFii]
MCAVLSVGVSVRSFCSCNACVISLGSLKLFCVSFVCYLFSFSFHSQTPFFRKLQKLKLR